jgi:hypothetical protein
VAALIKKDIGADPELVEGNRGEFTVWVGDELVSQKGPNGFPSDEEVLTAVRQATTQG